MKSQNRNVTDVLLQLRKDNESRVQTYETIIDVLIKKCTEYGDEIADLKKKLAELTKK